MKFEEESICQYSLDHVSCTKESVQSAGRGSFESIRRKTVFPFMTYASRQRGHKTPQISMPQSQNDSSTGVCSSNVPRLRRTSSMFLKNDEQSNPFRVLGCSSTILNSVVSILLILLCTSSGLAQMPDLSTVPTPPHFTHEPNPETLWFVLHDPPASHGHKSNGNSESLKVRTLRCVAKGVPDPTYEWEKDGKPFNYTEHERVNVTPDEGTFTIRELTAEDAGVYRCFAKNGNGTAVDNPIHLNRTYNNRIIDQTAEFNEIAHMDAFQRECEAPESAPIPFVFWLLKGKGQEFKSINESHISTVSEKGKGYIYFSYVTIADESDKLFFTCAAQNKVLNEYKFGYPFQFKVTDPAQDLLPREPHLQKGLPPSVTVLQSKPLNLHCIYSGYPPMYPVWKKDDENVDVSHVSFHNHKRSLVIQNVRNTDEGKYTCVFPSRRDLNMETWVTVEAKPYFPNDNAKPKSLNSSEGEAVIFNCGATGRPRPEIVFYKNGKELEPNDRVTTTASGQLKIVDLRIAGEDGSPGDNGNYQCEAKNSHGSVFADFYLNLLRVAPVLSAEPAKAEAVKSSSLIDGVGGLGDGKGKDGEGGDGTGGNGAVHPGTGDGKGGSTSGDGNGGKDNGYGGGTSGSGRGGGTGDGADRDGTGDGKGDNGDGSPGGGRGGDGSSEEDKGPDDGTAEVAFDIFAAPKPDAQWFHNGEEVDLEDDKYDSAVDPQGKKVVLVIKDLDDGDAGEYKVKLKNKYGETEAKTDLEVFEPSKIIKGPADGLEKDPETGKPKPLDVTAGDDIALPCETSSDPELESKISWHKDGDPIEENDRVKIKTDGEHNQTLSVDDPNADDSGTYSCLIRSKLDERTQSVDVVVKDVPSPPISVWVHNCDKSARTVEVKWRHIDEHRDTAPTTGFIIQYNAGHNGDEWETYQPVLEYPKEPPKGFYEGSGSITLSPYGDYKFRVLARNEVGDSSPFESKDVCQIPAAKPDMNPKNVEAKGNTPSNLVVSWEPLRKNEQNGPDFEYVVETRPEDPKKREKENDGWKKAVVPDPEADHYIVEGTDPYEPYEVRVTSKNSEGEADVEPEVRTGHSGEEPITEVPGDFELVDKESGQTARFRWKPINTTAFKGNFMGYKIVHWSTGKKRSGSPKQEAFFDPSASEGTVYNLKPFAENIAQILAYNGAGDGPPSPELRFDMPAGQPDPPSDVEVYPLNDGEVGVVWEEPEEHNGDPLGYKIEYVPVTDDSEPGKWKYDEDAKKEKVVEDPTSDTARIDDLEEDTLYEFRVSGLTNSTDEEDEGPIVGPPAKASARTLPADVPKVQPVPPTLKKVVLGDDYANVSWVPGKYNKTENRPIGDDFKVKYRKKGDPEAEWTEAPASVDNFTVHIPDLDPDTEYEIAIVSTAEDAEGNPLESQSVVQVHKTRGQSLPITAAWIIAIIVIIIILIIILIICCLIIRNRGAKYPVHDKEKAQGREPMLPEEKGFGEYCKPVDIDEKRSLTGSKPESETDSMAEYGDGETGRFTEDGSFIGMYVGATNVKPAQPSSTFV